MHYNKDKIIEEEYQNISGQLHQYSISYNHVAGENNG
jgi:hypothetical protein